MPILGDFAGFEWDQGNDAKNWRKHRVTREECEQVLLNAPLLVGYDRRHSRWEDRYYALGRTDRNRLLFLVFCARKDRVRVISARDMSRRERRRYHAL
ncbi:MAG: BrnT family toxin [Planctomycetes bacterium]|nr:BrnT family toxin [Planctomycetota bacterium]